MRGLDGGYSEVDHVQGWLLSAVGLSEIIQGAPVPMLDIASDTGRSMQVPADQLARKGVSLTSDPSRPSPGTLGFSAGPKEQGSTSSLIPR